MRSESVVFLVARSVLSGSVAPVVAVRVLLQLLHGFLADLLQVHELLVDAIHALVEFVGVLVEQGHEDSVVHFLRSLSCRVLQPKQEAGLNKVVERNNVKNEAEERFEDVEGGKDSPVDEPNFVIILILSSLQCLKTSKSWVESAYEA